MTVENSPVPIDKPQPTRVLALLPTPHRRGPVLESLAEVRREMARVYRQMRHGRIDTQDATRMTYVLTQIAKIIQVYELDARIAAVERALGRRRP